MITAENAKELQQKSVKARKAAKIAPLEPDTSPQIASEIADDYRDKRLVRVRKQLDKLDTMIEEELDPQKIDRLASAQMRLSEQERILRREPLPGSFRPQADKSSRQRNRPVEVWSDETPQQVVSGVPAQVPVQPITPPPVHGPENG